MNDSMTGSTSGLSAHLPRSDIMSPSTTTARTPLTCSCTCRDGDDGATMTRR